MLAKRWMLKNVLGRRAGVMVGQACGWARNLIKARGRRETDEAESLSEVSRLPRRVEAGDGEV